MDEEFFKTFGEKMASIFHVRIVPGSYTVDDTVRAELRFRTDRLIATVATQGHADYAAAHACERVINSLVSWVDIAKNGTKYTVNEILSLKNIEQRAAALKIMGADRLIQEAQAVLLNKSRRGNELYLIPVAKGIFEEDAYFVKYACPSTGRIYVSGVPPELFNFTRAVAHSANAFDKSYRDLGSPFERAGIKRFELEPMYMRIYPKECWADLAVAWKFRLSYEQYTKGLLVAREA